MIEDHWKPTTAKMSALFCCAFLSFLIFQLEGCHGQDVNAAAAAGPAGAAAVGGSNFFYYFSPTQRTQVNQASPMTPGNIFSSPFLNQQQQQLQQQLQQQSQNIPTFSPFLQQQTGFTNLPFQQVSSTQASAALLGYPQQQHQQQQQQHNTPASTIFTTQQPLGQFQQFPQFVPQAQQQNIPAAAVQPAFVQPQTTTTAAYSTFSRLGQNLFSAQNNILQQQQQAFLAGAAAPTLSPPQLSPQQIQQQQQQQLQTTSSPVPGSLSFYESPFQYFQHRLLQTQPTPAIPAPAPDAPLAATTSAPPSQQDAAVMPMPARRKQKLSARYRNYPIAPQLYYQFSPQYTSTSALPFTEERYYSTVVPSAPTPTGYAFSLGGDGPTTSSVHVSMGPLTKNVQQHLTEITNLRRISHINPPSRKPMIYRDQIAVENMNKNPVRNAFSAYTAMTSQEAPMMQATSEMAASGMTELPSALPTMMSMHNMSSTLDTLLNEPSFRMETIATPMVSSPVPVMIEANNAAAAEKISEAEVPRRMTIRKKIARKRLRLDESDVINQSGRSVDGNNVIITGERRRPTGRRRISQNRLSVNEPAKEYEGSQKGEVPQPNVDPIVIVTSSTPAPQTPTPAEPVSQQPEEQEQAQVSVAVASDSIPPSTTTTSQPPPQQEVEVEANIPQMSAIPEMMMDPSTQQEIVPEQEQQQQIPEEVASTPTTERTSVPLLTTPSTTTTPLPEMEALHPQEETVNPEEESSPPAKSQNIEADPKQYEDEYYEEYEDFPPGQQPNVSHVRDEGPGAPALISNFPPQNLNPNSASSESGSSSAELPVLNDVRKEDFPSVFRQSEERDNSVESDQGELITRVKSSRPAPLAPTQEDGSVEAVAVEPSQSSSTEPPPPSSTTAATTTTTTTAEYSPPATFLNQDPPEEQPPPNSEEIKEPIFEPLSTTEQAQMTTTTTTAPPPLSTTASPLPIQEHNLDHDSSLEEEYGNDSFEDHEEEAHQPEPSSSTTDPPALQVLEHAEEPQVVSSTESSLDEEIHPMQPQQPQYESQEQSDKSLSIEEDVQVVSLPKEGSSLESGSSSTTEEPVVQLEEEERGIEVSSSTESIPIASSSTTPAPVVEEANANVENENAAVDEESPSSSTTITPLPSPATTESSIEPDQDHSQEQSSQSLENSGSQEQNLSEEGDKISSDEIVGQAQRQALEETLKRLREQRQQQTTESSEDLSSSNSTSAESEMKGKLKNFVRRPLQLNNLPLPTTAPVTNTNAVLDDGEGEHQSRHQVIQKIQRFRANYKRVSTTTKRPRRVTRPSSTERLPSSLLPDLDTYSESSSTAGPQQKSEEILPNSIIINQYPSRSRFRTTTTTTTPAPIIMTTTTEAPSSTSTMEAVTTVEPTTTTTTPATDILTTIIPSRKQSYSKSRRVKTFSTAGTSTTTPSTTTILTTDETDFYEKDDENDDDASNSKINDNNNNTNDNGNTDDDHVYYDEGHSESSSSTSSTTETDVSSSTTSTTEGRFNYERYTTPSSTTTSTTTTTERGPYMTTMTDVEFREVEINMEADSESDTSSSTTTTSTTTEIPLGTTTSVGQLIIHEILPTMPPLKEVSFVIGESVEDQDHDQVIQSQSNEEKDNKQNVQAVVRVEAKVSVGEEEQAKLTSSSQQEQDYSGSGQLLSSEEGSNEGNEGFTVSSTTISPEAATPAASESEVSSSVEERNGRKVRVVIRRQKSRSSSSNTNGTRNIGQDNRRRRRKVLHRQLRRRT